MLDGVRPPFRSSGGGGTNRRGQLGATSLVFARCGQELLQDAVSKSWNGEHGEGGGFPPRIPLTEGYCPDCQAPMEEEPVSAHA